jgi:hypothetical protein
MDGATVKPNSLALKPSRTGTASHPTTSASSSLSRFPSPSFGMGWSRGRTRLWLVLQERETDGDLVAFDPSSRMWGLVMGHPDAQFVLVSGLTEAYIDTVIGM